MTTEPVEPAPSPWAFPPPETADEFGVVGIGADLAPGTLLAAYRSGLFPMPAGRDSTIAWWSPHPRGVIPLDGLRVSRSLRRSCRRYEVRVDQDFEQVMAACASQDRKGGWITESIIDAYVELHRLGWAHSVETYDADGRLVGGLYGVAIAGFFAGESMFHRCADASKVALVGLVGVLGAGGASLLDVQWTTPHLRSLGAVELDRPTYLDLLDDAIEGPARPWSNLEPGTILEPQAVLAQIRT
jgi:leucyl/phenylalanyl-tRNA---protein transferase